MLEGRYNSWKEMWRVEYNIVKEIGGDQLMGFLSVV
jgi:hypothetical protein